MPLLQWSKTKSASVIEVGKGTKGRATKIPQHCHNEKSSITLRT